MIRTQSTVIHYATVQGRRQPFLAKHGDAARCTANPLIPENHGEFPLTNYGGWATNGNGYTTARVWLAGGHASGRLSM